ncbi:MAG: nuclear transport factor 2 family protein [Bacteroidota bacterium]|nr:nuclear transport factor 2 family protein [Bacteroidota bacterium]
MKPEENKAIAIKWFEAFNEHNLEKLLTLYDDNAQHYSPKLKVRKPETRGFVMGKDQLRDWWADSFKRLPTLKYEVIKLTADEAQVFMEYTRFVNGEQSLSVGEVLEIEKGKIVASRVYHG